MPPEPSVIASLGWAIRGQALAKKSTNFSGREWLDANRAPALARHIFEVNTKGAIGAGSTTDSTLGAYGISIGEWSASARTRSAFYRILADSAFTRVPANTAVGISTSSPSAGVVAEGKAIPVSKVTLNNILLTRFKVAALLVVTDSLLADVGAAGQQLFNRELLGAISDAVDAAFVDKIDTGTTPISSTAPLADLRAALLAINTAGIAKPYWLGSQDVAKLGSTLSDTKGGPAFAACSATGGELANLPFLVSSGIASGVLYLIDAAGLAVDAEVPTVDISSSAVIQMDTAPTMDASVPTATNVVSMFQTNSTAIKSVAEIACEKLRSNAVAVVTGITSTTWAVT